MKKTLVRNTLKPGDIGYLIYLHGINYTNEFGYDHTFECYVATLLSDFARTQSEREKIWIIEQNSSINGSIAVSESGATEAQLRWFLISPQLRGTGIGSRLIKEAISFAKNVGYKTMVLWTVKGLHGARHLYQKNGFVLTEQITHKIWGAIRTEQKYELNFEKSCLYIP